MDTVSYQYSPFNCSLLYIVHPSNLFPKQNNTVDLGVASEAYTKAKAFAAQLNNTEKISIVMAQSVSSANASWTSYSLADGVDGLNFYFHVSAFTSSNALAQTWDRSLFGAHFAAVGSEYRALGLDLVDGAVIGPLGRDALGGRSNEAYSPDPYLSGVAAAEGVKAQQAVGVVSGESFVYEKKVEKN